MDSVAPILALMALHPSHQMASFSWQISLKWRATLSIESLFIFKSADGKMNSYCTNFVFVILPKVSYLGGNGIAFAISHTADLSTALARWHLGLYICSQWWKFNQSHLFVVELGTIMNPEIMISMTIMLELMSMAWCPWSCILPVTMRIALVCSRT